MIPIVLAMASMAVATSTGTAFGDLQVLAGPDFDRFVTAADAICPARRVRAITPADLDGVQEEFIARLPPARRDRLAAANRGAVRCAGHDGLSCPTTATLAALAHERLMPRFAAFACRAALPR